MSTAPFDSAPHLQDTTTVDVVPLPDWSTRHELDDLVTIHPDCARNPAEGSRVWRITKLPTGGRGVNYTATPLDGGRPMLGRASLWKPYAGNHDAALAAARPAPARPVLGAVVTVSGPNWKQPLETRWVVLGTGDTTAKLAKLGGDDNRFWPRIPLSYLATVDPDSL